MMKHVRGKDANYHDGSFMRWAKEWSYEFRVPAGAGETVGVAKVDPHPWDEFYRRADASPIPPELRPVDPDAGDEDDPPD